MSAVRLSVLDQSPIKSGSTPVEAVQETLDLAQAAERLGYHRYLVAEHHSSSGLAGASPEVLIGQIAQPRHSPLNHLPVQPGVNPRHSVTQRSGSRTERRAGVFQG